MQPAFVVRFRPTGPWRIGPDSGARDRVDRIYHSDTLFSAVSAAMAQLGMLEEWLAATAGNPQGSAVRFSSCFPYLEEVHFVAPPRTVWPPPPSTKVRWQNARLVPLSLVCDLLDEKPLHEDRWLLDGPSECLIPSDIRFSSPGPFRPAFRSRAAVDRLSGQVEVHATACLEFAEGGGLWAVVAFADETAWKRWAEPVRGALRLLADSGLGGERSQGWGHSEQPEFIEGELPGLIVPNAPANGELPAGVECGYWLLSLFTPAGEDAIDWPRCNYAFTIRGGRVESRARWGERKKLLRMIAEGSVLMAGAPPRGAARDVSPDGFPHPVYRSGIALAVPIPARAAERLSGAA